MSGLIGKAGEAWVAAQLLRRGFNVAYPALDKGVDLIAYREGNLCCSVPIQVKTASKQLYRFHKSVFRVPGIVLVQVWHMESVPQCYIFNDIERVEEALGEHAATPSWTVDGVWRTGNPGNETLQRMKPHLEKWCRIESRLMPGQSAFAAAKPHTPVVGDDGQEQSA